MKRIKLTPEKLAELIKKVKQIIIGENVENNHEKVITNMVITALAITEIPPDEVISIESVAETISEVEIEYSKTDSGSPEEKATIRRGIDLCNTEDEFNKFWKEYIEYDTFECTYAIRKLTQILYGESKTDEKNIKAGNLLPPEPCC